MGRAFDHDRRWKRFAELEAARLAASSSGKVLTPRPILAESSARVASMESEHMRNIEQASGEVIAFPAQQRATSPRIIATLALQRGLNSLAPLGSRRCRKMVRRMDVTLAESEAVSDGLDRRADNEARAMLRIRCGICPARCDRPLL